MKKKAKTLDDYLPKSVDTKVVQVDLPEELHQAMKAYLKARGLGWTEFVEASARRALDEATASISA